MAKKAAKAVKQETDEQVVSIETDKKAITNLLPNSIEIVGLGLGRVIAINDRVLSAEKSIKINPIAQGFNWGYEGKEVSQLSLAVLAEYVPADIASAYYSVLRQQVFSKIPLIMLKSRF